MTLHGHNSWDLKQDDAYSPYFPTYCAHQRIVMFYHYKYPFFFHVCTFKHKLTWATIVVPRIHRKNVNTESHEDCVLFKLTTTITFNYIFRIMQQFSCSDKSVSMTTVPLFKCGPSFQLQPWMMTFIYDVLFLTLYTLTCYGQKCETITNPICQGICFSLFITVWLTLMICV